MSLKAIQPRMVPAIAGNDTATAMISNSALARAAPPAVTPINSSKDPIKLAPTNPAPTIPFQDQPGAGVTTWVGLMAMVDCAPRSETGSPIFGGTPLKLRA